MFRRERFHAGQKASKNGNLALDSRAAEVQALLNRSDSESCRPLIRKRRGDLGGAVAVGVGFDHRKDRGFRARGIPDRPEIPPNRAQIHAGERA
jgi:hypothetical protein